MREQSVKKVSLLYYVSKLTERLVRNYFFKKKQIMGLVNLPPDVKVIDCKWLFSFKYNTYGEMNKYKAHLVSKGFSQKFVTDYYETFAPIHVHNTNIVKLMYIIQQ